MAEAISPVWSFLEPSVCLRWRFTFPVPEPYGVGIDCAILVGDRVYVFRAGNTSVRCAILWYNTGEWQLVPTALKPQVGQAAALAGDKIYMFGGGLHASGPGCSYELVRMDLVLNTSEVMQSGGGGPGPRSYMSAVYAEWRKEIVVFGGMTTRDIASCQNDMYAWEEEEKRWREVKARGELPSPRSGHCVALVGLEMFLFGGKEAARTCDNTLWIADLSGLGKRVALWSKVKAVGQSPLPRAYASFARLNDRIILYGGMPNVWSVKSVTYAYSPRECKWINSNKAGLKLTGFPPIWNKQLRAIELGASILCITNHGLYELGE